MVLSSKVLYLLFLLLNPYIHYQTVTNPSLTLPNNPIFSKTLQYYFMQSNNSTSAPFQRKSTFTKSTNRKYFGGGSNIPFDMKKSSILLNYTPKEDQSRLLGSKSPTLLGQQPQYKTIVQNNNIEKREKPTAMYSSMIIGKNDEYKKPSGLSSGNSVRQLHDWADQLKKKLTPFIDASKKADQTKDDLINKYSPNPIVKKEAPPATNPSLSNFSKVKKTYEQEDYSKDFTDYSKFSGLLKPAKTERDLHTYNNSTNQTIKPKPSTFLPTSNHSYAESSFKKETAHQNTREPSYSTSSYSTDYSHFSTNQYNSPPRQVLKKPLRKDDFQIGKKLGNGMFGQVFLVRHKTLRFVCAMKILKKSVVRQQKVEDQLVRQIKIQFYLQHQNVINLYGFFYDNQCVYLLQQLCMDGHLFSMLKEKHRFQDGQAADIIRQICLGLDYIHRERIIHRDIKPQNIIMHQGIAKICDFGWAVYRGHGLRSTFCGTPLYTPPELLRGEMYDQKFDIWAIGILAYELIVGRFPFKIFCEDDLNRILTDEITFPFSVDVTPDAKNFIMSIIRKDPRDRIEIDQILSHPFLCKNVKPSIVIDFKI